MSKLLNIPSSSSDNILVMANYTKLSESIRRLTPQGIQCSVFCGGINCKYENPESWATDSLAIQGIYSHWITDNILAMARPRTTVIIRKHVIEQFHSLGIKSIINLQSSKEHASCGELLEDSGFSYDPNIFMENDIYYYNFAWKDYGDATLSELLNSVKVLTFAVTEGRVAVHCHAGLGRTGVLIACYLVYSLRVTANDAIKYVRFRRPGSVQTRGQIICVRHFAQFVLPKSITFYIKDSKDKYMTEFDLKKFLKRQRIVLHGYDERKFKYLPKIIHIICERLLELCGCYTEEFVIDSSSITYNFLSAKIHNSIQLQDNICYTSNIDNLPSNTELVTIPTSESTCSISVSSGSSECDVLEDNIRKMDDSCSDLSSLDRDEVQKELLLDENKCYLELQKRKKLDEIIPPKEIFTSADIINSLIKPIDSKDSVVAKTLLQYEQDINISPLGWSKLKIETDTTTLTGLLFDWLESLKSPVFGQDHLEIIVICFDDAKRCLEKFELEEACLVEYLLNFVTKLFPLSEEDIDNILMRFIASLTQQSVVINSVLLPLNKDFQKLRDGTLRCTLQFFKSLLSLICNHHQQNKVLKTVVPQENL